MDLPPDFLGSVCCSRCVISSNVIAVFLSCLIPLVAVFLRIELPDSVPVCGFWTPGRSKLWGKQLAGCRAEQPGKGADGTPAAAALCPSYPGGPILRMQDFRSAFAELDAGGTSVPVLEGLPSDARLYLHAHMIPFLHRTEPGILRLDAAAFLREGVKLPGSAKLYTEDYVMNYHGGVEHHMELGRYLAFQRKRHVVNKSEQWYWLGCFTGQDIIRADALEWLHRMARESLLRPPLLGLHLPVSLCVRVATSNARLRMHHDAMHNTLFQIHGQRKVVLMMPDLGAATLRPSHQEGFDAGGHTTAAVGEVDPRASITTDKSQPGQKDWTRVLTAVLEPGDALFIPAMWWHYIEATGMPAIGVDGNFSIAISAFAGGNQLRHVNQSFLAHPCDPDAWSVQEHCWYTACEVLRSCQQAAMALWHRLF